MTTSDDKEKELMRGKGKKGHIQETIAEVQQALENVPKPQTLNEQIAVGLVIAVLGAIATYAVRRALIKYFGKEDE